MEYYRNVEIARDESIDQLATAPDDFPDIVVAMTLRRLRWRERWFKAGGDGEVEEVSE